jgi:hypothetical protein
MKHKVNLDMVMQTFNDQINTWVFLATFIIWNFQTINATSTMKIRKNQLQFCLHGKVKK